MVLVLSVDISFIKKKITLCQKSAAGWLLLFNLPKNEVVSKLLMGVRP